MNSIISLLTLALLFLTTSINAQELPEFRLEKARMEAHMRYLASDELQGRRTGEPGNQKAADYIAATFRELGLQMAPGMKSYFQPVPLESITPPVEATLQLEDTEYQQGENLLIMLGNARGLKGNAIFAGHGWIDEAKGLNDYEGLKVKGKVVFVLPGTPEAQDPLTIFKSMSKKRKYAKERGAVALIELYRLQFPWDFFRSWFNKESLSLAVDGDKKGEGLVYGWIKEEKGDAAIRNLMEGQKVAAKLNSSGFSYQRLTSPNVIGIIEGSDPALKEEYVLLTAHFDHVGTGRNGGGAYSPEDSIFNGARDNAFGTVALLGAAEALSQQPPRRSVIVLAVTGEELGLLGSQYYAENPIIPLRQTIFNLNTDGAGYNDVSYVSVVGYGRTGTDGLIDAGANIFGLDIFPNPAPEQNLFDRSDNVSFAKEGVPAVSFSPGMTRFDEEVARYYHQVADNPDTIDYDYLHKFSQAFARTARLIADEPSRPEWVEGDKYQKAGQELYER